MKRVSNFTCWTDYPILALGDVPGVQAPVRRVRVLSYDGNKYATVAVMPDETIRDSIKAGYLYSQPGRLNAVRQVNRRKLERMLAPSPSEGA